MIRLLVLFLFLAPAGYSQGSAIITTIAGTGKRGFSGDGGPATQAQFAFLLGYPDLGLEEHAHLTVDGDGNVYVPDQGNDRIRKISIDGMIATVAGDGRSGFDGDGGPAAKAALFSPSAVRFDGAGNLYLADLDNHRIRKISPDGTITTIAGNGRDRFLGNEGSAVRASLNSPGGLAFDAAGNLYIADTYNNQIRKVALPSGIITGFAGSGPDNFDYAGDGGKATLAALALPTGLAFDAAGNLYIADQNNSVIRKVNLDGIITTFAGTGDFDFRGDGGPAERAALNFPADVAFDAAGNLYIADEDNNRVRKVDTKGIITTVAGTGEPGYGGDGGPPLTALLNHPSGLAFDKQGNLYITDHYNFRIRKIVFNPPALAASATALAFAGVAGGAAPAAQTLTLSNSGAGTLNYTITPNQSWLSATPVSGSLGTPATVTVRVNIANLAAGDYSGTLTVAAGGAVNSPVVVRVTLTVRPLAVPVPAFAAGDVANAASFIRAPLAPGEAASIFGSNLGPSAGLGAAIDPATGRLATIRGEVSVLFNDVAGPLFFVQQNQINVQVPFEVAGQPTVRVVVKYLGTASAPVTLTVAPAVPGIFTVRSGAGQAALLNEDFSVNSAANPAARSSVVQIFLTGQGTTIPPGVTGQLPQAPFPAPGLSVTVRIGGREARTLFVGLAPGLVGLLQINAVVPEDTTPGDNVALEVAVGGAVSQPGVTLAVR